MRISQSILDSRYSNAKRKKYQDTMEEDGFISCESCGANEQEEPIDCSHIISREDCKRFDLLELIYDLANLRWHCRTCHRAWENGWLNRLGKLGLDLFRNLEYIEGICGTDKYFRPLLMKYKNRWQKHI